MRTPNKQSQGGQNVNKVNTKADVRFVLHEVSVAMLHCVQLHVAETWMLTHGNVLSLEQATWLDEGTRQRLEGYEGHRMNNAGEFVVTSQRHRT